MFETFTTVTREELRHLVEAVDIERLCPDRKALSWNVVVPAGEEALSGFERSVRLDDSVEPEGYRELSVRPAEVSVAGPRHVVKNIEPMASNRGAFGFDIGSNAERRKTVELARDLEEALGTAPITLTQKTGSQKGFLTLHNRPRRSAVRET